MSERPRDVDDLASALLDGLLTGEDADAARRDPAVVQRVDEMRAAQQALRQVPAADPVRREAALAAALAALDPPDPLGIDPHDLDLDAAGPSAVGSLGPEAPAAGRSAAPPSPQAPAMRPPPPASPARRRRAWADPRWLAAAAVLVLVMAVGGLVVAGSSSDQDDAATSAIETPSAPEDEDGGSEAGDAGTNSRTQADAAPDTTGGGTDTGAGSASGPEEEESDVAQLPSTAGTEVVDLGAVRSVDELATRARSSTARPPGSTSAPDDSEALSGDDPCPEPADARGTVVLRGRAQLDGEPVDVWVYDDGAQRMVVIDASCAVVADQPLGG